MDGLQPCQSLPLTALNHISKVCADVPKSVTFYRDVLGFFEIKRPQAFDFEGSWLFNYGIGIHLIRGTPVLRSDVIDPKSDHLSFQSDNLSDVERRLKAHDIKYTKCCVDEGGVRVTQIFFHDPDHNMVEICNCDCLPVIPLCDPGTVTQSCKLQRVSSNTSNRHRVGRVQSLTQISSRNVEEMLSPQTAGY